MMLALMMARAAYADGHQAAAAPGLLDDGYELLRGEGYIAVDEGNPVGFGTRAGLTLDECKQACDDEEKCNSFEYCHTNRAYSKYVMGNCHLKDKVFNGDEPTMPYHERSMWAHCETYYDSNASIRDLKPVTVAPEEIRPNLSPEKLEFATEMHTCHKDQVLRKVQGSSYDECSHDCAKDPRCTHFAVSDTGICKTFDSCDDIDRTRNVWETYAKRSDATRRLSVGGYKTLGGEGMVAVEHGNPVGPELSGLSLEQCMQECTDEPMCNSFDYCHITRAYSKVVKGACFLKDKIFNGDEAIMADEKRSMFAECETYYLDQSQELPTPVGPGDRSDVLDNTMDAPVVIEPVAPISSGDEKQTFETNMHTCHKDQLLRKVLSSTLEDCSEKCAQDARCTHYGVSSTGICKTYLSCDEIDATGNVWETYMKPGMFQQLALETSKHTCDKSQLESKTCGDGGCTYVQCAVECAMSQSCSHFALSETGVCKTFTSCDDVDATNNAWETFEKRAFAEPRWAMMRGLPENRN